MIGDISAATERAIAAASHLTDADAGAVEALRALALKIDLADEYLQALADDAEQHKLRPPSQDNVSIPTYLKYCDALGLTPIGRKALESKKAEGAASEPRSGVGARRAAAKHLRSA